MPESDADREVTKETRRVRQRERERERKREREVAGILFFVINGMIMSFFYEIGDLWSKTERVRKG